MRLIGIFIFVVLGFSSFAQNDSAPMAQWAILNPFTKDLREDERMSAYKKLPLPSYRQILSDTWMRTVGTISKIESQESMHRGDDSTALQIFEGKAKEQMFKMADSLKIDEKQYWRTHPSFAPAYPPWHNEKSLLRATQYLEELFVETRKLNDRNKIDFRGIDTAFGDIHSALRKGFEKINK